MKKILSLMLNQTKDNAEQYANYYFESSEHEESTKTQNTQMEKEQYFYSSPSDEDELNTSNEIVEKTLDNSFGRVHLIYFIFSLTNC